MSDAQGGFKALPAEAPLRLLSGDRVNGRFFDTELLVAAQRERMRRHEVPVDWVQDNSRVDMLELSPVWP